jgi:hypothetical protein
MMVHLLLLHDQAAASHACTGATENKQANSCKTKALSVKPMHTAKHRLPEMSGANASSIML